MDSPNCISLHFCRNSQCPIDNRTPVCYTGNTPKDRTSQTVGEFSERGESRAQRSRTQKLPCPESCPRFLSASADFHHKSDVAHRAWKCLVCFFAEMSRSPSHKNNRKIARASAPSNVYERSKDLRAAKKHRMPKVKKDTPPFA